MNFTKITTVGEQSFEEALRQHLELTKEEQLLLNESTLDETMNEEPVKKAVEIIKEAMMNNDKIVISGDYDCDGISSTTILYHTLKKQYAHIGFYIPNRFVEGYGLRVSMVEQYYAKNYSLIICVDNGVQAHDALARAAELGMKVLIIDHHHYEDQPLCTHLLHPKLLSPFYYQLSAAGLCYLVASKFSEELDYITVLAGICVVSDVVSVTQFNRHLLIKAISLLNERKGGVIHQLYDSPSYDEGVIGFSIVPIINAIGRMSDIANPNTLVRFLSESHLFDQANFIQQLHDINAKRKAITISMKEMVKQQINPDDLFIVLHSDQFHEGVVGLLAGSIASEYQKPVMVVSLHNGIYKGSVRSVEGFDLQKIFEDIKPELISFGGHAMAAGISFLENKRNLIDTYLQNLLSTFPKVEKSFSVINIPMEECTLDHTRLVKSFAPYGQDFPIPLFYSVAEVEQVSILKNVHLKLQIAGRTLFYWFAPQTLLEVQKGDKIALIYQFDENEFRGRQSWQGKIIYFEKTEE